MDPEDLADLTQASLLLHHLVQAGELEEQQQQLQKALFEPSSTALPLSLDPHNATTEPSRPAKRSPRQPSADAAPQQLTLSSSALVSRGLIEEVVAHPASDHVQHVPPMAAKPFAPVGQPVIDAPRDPQHVGAVMRTPNSGAAPLGTARFGGEACGSSSSAFSLASPSESTGSCGALPRGAGIGGDLSHTPPPGLPGGPADAAAQEEADELRVFTARSTNRVVPRRAIVPGMKGEMHASLITRCRS